MKSVAEVFGKTTRRRQSQTAVEWRLPEQLMGIEVEVEVGVPDVRLPENVAYWRTTRDGSLRNGTEYVLSMPMNGGMLASAISELFNDSNFVRTATGSTHIHMDMFDEGSSPELVKVLALLVFVLEPAIFALTDPGREWCGYTNKLASAPSHVLGCILNAGEDDDFAALKKVSQQGDQGRYYGLNVMALAKYGSIEFRYFPTATSAEELIGWVQMVQAFKQAALAVGTMEQLLRTLSNDDLYDRLLTTYFHEWKSVMVREVPHYMAASLTKKAMAVAATFKQYGTKSTRFDTRAITNNKALAKFIKSVPVALPPAIEPLIIAPRSAGMPSPTIPLAGEVPAGQVMIYENNIYIASPRGGGLWCGYPFEGEASREEMAVALRTIETYIERLSAASLVANGYSPTSARYVVEEIIQSREQLRYILTGRSGGRLTSNRVGRDLVDFVIDEVDPELPEDQSPEVMETIEVVHEMEDEPEEYDPDEDDERLREPEPEVTPSWPSTPRTVQWRTVAELPRHHPLFSFDEQAVHAPIYTTDNQEGSI